MTLDQKLAKALETAIVTGLYNPEYPVDFSKSYMCNVLRDMWGRQEINQETYWHGVKVIQDALGSAATLPYLLLKTGLIRALEQEFEWRIHGSCFYWRLIRKLRQESALV